MIFHIDNPFAHNKSDTSTAPSHEAEVASQEAYISPESAKEVTDLGQRALQSETILQSPTPTETYSLPQVTQETSSPTEGTVEDVPKYDEFYPEDAEKYNTLGAFGDATLSNPISPVETNAIKTTTADQANEKIDA